MNYYNASSQYLIHEGVKGQKWGEKHGPPYPLDDNARVQAQRKANYKVNTSLKSKIKNTAKKIYEDHNEIKNKKLDIKKAKVQAEIIEAQSKADLRKEKELQEKLKRTKNSEAGQNLKEIRAKNISQLTNEELKFATDRMNLEQNYMKAISAYPTKKTRGQKVSEFLLKEVGQQTILPAAKKQGEVYLERMIAKAIGNPEPGKKTNVKINKG